MEMVRRLMVTGLQGERKGGINGWSTGEFWGSEAIFLYNTITADLYIFVKTHRMFNTG